MKLSHATAFVSLSALESNFRLLLSRLRADNLHSFLYCVVKSDAYGHGLVPCAKALSRAGATRFAVATAEEAVSLRLALPKAEILILGITPPDKAKTLSSLSLTQTVHTLSYALLLSQATEKPLSVHLKLDCGMKRLGFPCREKETSLSDAFAVSRLPRLKIDGVYGHLSSADSPIPEKTSFEISAFHDFVAELRKGGVNTETHLCNSAGTLRFGSAGCDGARCGLSLYGISPSEKLYVPSLRPALSLFCPIIQIKAVKKGESLGYGGAWTAERDTRIAVLPMGYRDGLLRYCEGGFVRLYGHLVRLVGHICMDLCAVNIGDIPAREGDLVTVYDKTGSTLPALAKHAGTIPYELLSLLGDRIQRKYIS